MRDELRPISNNGLRIVALAKHRREQRSWIGRRVEGIATVSSVQGNLVKLEVQVGQESQEIRADARDGAVAAELDRGQTVRVRGRLGVARTNDYPTTQIPARPAPPFLCARCEKMSISRAQSARL
jgi:hypothetical protein